MTGLETKLTQLKMGVDRTEAILNSGKRVAIKQHKPLQKRPVSASALSKHRKLRRKKGSRKLTRGVMRSIASSKRPTRQ